MNQISVNRMAFYYFFNPPHCIMDIQSHEIWTCSLTKDDCIYVYTIGV